jgi:DNA polymerase-3 subunit alpha
LFGEAGDDLPEPRLSLVEDWLPAERLTEEFKAIGFYLSGHPLDDYMGALKRQDVKTLDEVTALAEQKGAVLVKMAGVVAGRQERKSARGNRFAFAQLSDTTGGYEVTLFSETLEKFANYGFNKSHAAAYAVVSYQTAWLKANHPVEFMAAVMNCDIHLTDKLAVYFQEVKKGLKLPYAPPCVNRSDAVFQVRGGVLHYALGALKNVGVEAMRLIVDGRGDKPFATLYDFARRVDLKRIGKRPLEMLARAGAFDELDRNRRRVLDSIEALMNYSAAIND